LDVGLGWGNGACTPRQREHWPVIRKVGERRRISRHDLGDRWAVDPRRHALSTLVSAEAARPM
jgi:hypothetical protein